MPAQQRHPVYVRIGDDGQEQRIGTVRLDAGPEAVAQAVASLLRAAAFEVEVTVLPLAHTRGGPTMSSDPQPPVNLRLITDRGAEVPIDCAYIGPRDGVQVWRALVPDHVSVVVAYAFDALPANTAVELELRQ